MQKSFFFCHKKIDNHARFVELEMFLLQVNICECRWRNYLQDCFSKGDKNGKQG